MEKLVYVGRDPRQGYIYVKLYQGMVKSAYVYYKRRKGMKYFALLTVRVAKTFSGEVRRRLMQFAADRVERAVKAFIAAVEEKIAELASKSPRVFYAFEPLYKKINSYVAYVEDLGIAQAFLDKARSYVDVDAMWREAALRFSVALPLNKALEYTYWH
ncbi:hypothetical protein [Pyrobaculum sp.]|uniref:hypothetical protein n=1 Tax=Pyrobaculum sp. TaxID=2004705 RepID=UPI003161B478